MAACLSLRAISPTRSGWPSAPPNTALICSSSLSTSHEDCRLCARYGHTANPLASSILGLTSSAHAALPCRCQARWSPLSSQGTATAVAPILELTPSAKYMVSFAAPGAASLMSIISSTSSPSSFFMRTTMNEPPKSPEDDGFTTPLQIPTATAASTAFPPSSRMILAPTSEQSPTSLATAPPREATWKDRPLKSREASRLPGAAAGTLGGGAGGRLPIVSMSSMASMVHGTEFPLLWKTRPMSIPTISAATERTTVALLHGGVGHGSMKKAILPSRLPRTPLSIITDGPSSWLSSSL